MNTSLKVLVMISILFFTMKVNAQEKTQSIRGQVIDVDSKYPVIGANVIVIDSDPIIGASTDAQGFFYIENVAIGRVSLKISAIGYEEAVAKNLLLMTGKELEANIEMGESMKTLDAVVIKASSEKIAVNNELATVSARSFNVEETQRYAGSRNDPARMASNFAGVSGANDSRNDIIIRGNSPAGVLWRLEGVDIPSPNHFSSFGSTGGPVSMLNNTLLAKSDFMTAAFPANYGNALAGVFDLQMRNGNNQNREHLFQIGFNGFELGTEGNFNANKKSSYLINYRYSTLGVFDALGVNFGTGNGIPKYQDLSFKLNFPTKKTGRFVLFGLGGISDIAFLGSETDLDAKNETDLFGSENNDLYDETGTGIIGLSHTYFFNKNTFSKITLAASHQRESVEIDSVSNTDRSILTRYTSINNKQTKYSINALVNTKINVRNTFTAGVMLESYDVQFADSTLINNGVDSSFWISIKEGSGTSLLSQAYANWQHKFSKNLTLNTGLHFQHFNLSKSNALEPRIGLKYQVSPKQSLSFGYGVHHQLQALPVYYTTTKLLDGNYASLNKSLDFTQSQHLALGYDINLSSDFRIKSELYYQAIKDVPVERTASTFSMLNAGANFGTPDNGNLVNNGKGKNYGIELTIEKFYSKQYYFLLTTSIFKSEYQGSDKVWRSTAFNGSYVVNVLGGKEFKIGKNNNTLSFDIKMTSAGGRAYTPIDLASSKLAGGEVLFDNQAFSKNYDSYFRTDLKISYRISKKKFTHEWAIDIQNITNRENIFSESYNRRTQQITRQNQLGIFPIPQYRILF